MEDNKQKYAQSKRIFRNRNSYSKTDMNVNRVIKRNERWLQLKNKAQRVLEDKRYKKLRKQRSVEVETVFGQIKWNQVYGRFLLGLPQTSINHLTLTLRNSLLDSWIRCSVLHTSLIWL